MKREETQTYKLSEEMGHAYQGKGTRENETVN